MDRKYYVGPLWLVNVMKEVYGTSIDYYVQDRLNGFKIRSLSDGII